MDFDGFFKGKKVLVTGHTGFKGAWLSIWLNELGAEVIGYALDPIYEKSLFELSKLGERITSVIGDIRDIEHLDSVFRKYNPDIVIHLAAQAIVRRSYDIPRETFETNIMGTINIIECSRKHNIKSVVLITSDKCYKNVEKDEGYVETDAFSDMDPYSCSKGCAEMVAASYRNSFGMRIATTRAGNVIGGGDWASDRLIPDVMRCLERGSEIIIRSPDSIRPWQFVLEPLSGYLMIAKKQYEGENLSSGWNFGPEKENRIPVIKLIEIMVKKWGSGKIVIKGDDSKKHESKLLHLDCTKAKTRLGWKPKLRIEEALDYIVRWYKDYKSSDVYDLCVGQIKKFGGHND